MSTRSLTLPEQRRQLVQKLKIDQEPNPSRGTDAGIAQFVLNASSYIDHLIDLN